MKYRIHTKIPPKFIVSDEWYVSPTGTVYYHDIMENELVRADSNSVSIQKFTELYDINEKPLYEGDQVETEDGNFQIDYTLGEWLLGETRKLIDYWHDYKNSKPIINVKLIS